MSTDANIPECQEFDKLAMTREVYSKLDKSYSIMIQDTSKGFNAIGVKREADGEPVLLFEACYTSQKYPELYLGEAERYGQLSNSVDLEVLAELLVLLKGLL